MFFLELTTFFDDPIYVGNLISGSSALSKSNLNIWKVSVHVLLKPSLMDFEHYLASKWNWYNCVVVWTFFGAALLGIEIKTDLFQSCGLCWVFQTCWHIVCSTFTASSFKIWSSSAGIPSPPLALFIVIVPKAHLTLHSRMSKRILGFFGPTFHMMHAGLFTNCYRGSACIPAERELPPSPG